MRWRTAIVASLLALAGRAHASPSIEGGFGLSVLGADRGGESDTKQAEGPALDLGVAWRAHPSVTAVVRVLATTGTEDEQHAHDHVTLAATARFAGARAWFEIGPGIAMYRGRYRYESFWSAEKAYDFDFPAIGVVLTAGVVVYRWDAMQLDAHANLVHTFGDEVATVRVLNIMLGARYVL